MTDAITILTERYDARLAKKHTYDPTRGAWITEAFSGRPKWFSYREVAVTCLGDLAVELKRVAADPSKTIIRARPNAKAAEIVAKTGFTRRTKEHFDAAPRRWVCIDIDNLIAPGLDIRTEPDAMIAWVVKNHFPAEFQDIRIIWQLSSSAGIKDPEAVKCHLWVWLSRPLGFEELKAWRKLGGFPADNALFVDVQIHYTADPSFVGAPDPCSTRWGFLPGSRETVEVPPIDLEAAKAAARERGETLSGMVSGANVAEILAQMGDGEGLGGFHNVILSAQMKWARTTPPAQYAATREALKATIREAARNAPRMKTRTPADVEQYLSDSALDAGIDGAIRRAGIRRAEKAPDASEFLSLEDAETATRSLKNSLRRFFYEVLQVPTAERVFETTEVE